MVKLFLKDKVKRGGLAMSSEHFCPCTDYSCQFNPHNHEKGCDLCIEDSLKCKEIPKCFFLQITDDISNITDWSFEAFSKLV